MSILRYTGHPLPDVGVATITAAAGVGSPSEVTEQHIETFTEDLIDIYMNAGVAGFLSRNVFANAGFANPAQLNDPRYTAARLELLRCLLNLWRPGAPIPTKMTPASALDVCAFSGDPAAVRTSRMYIPMTTSEESINFLPEGRKGLPVSGWCLLAILAMPLGALKTGANLVVVHSHAETLLQYFARRNLERNRFTFHTKRLDDMPMYSFARTYIVKDLMDLQGHPRGNQSITVYKFNSDSQDAHVDIFPLPSRAVRFALLARSECPDAWNYIVQSAQSLEPDPERVEQKKSKTRSGEEKIKSIQTFGDRNYFYEDLFGLPLNAVYFLRRYLLRLPGSLPARSAGAAAKYDPRSSYLYTKDSRAISWPLVGLFLMEVMKMDQERIEAIQAMADRLAKYIQEQDNRLFKQLFTARSEYQIRFILLKAANAASGVLLPYGEFVRVFFVDDGDTLRSDWSLARDLLMVRIIEQLHKSQWLETHAELVQETNTELETSTAP